FFLTRSAGEVFSVWRGKDGEGKRPRHPFRMGCPGGGPKHCHKKKKTEKGGNQPNNTPPRHNQAPHRHRAGVSSYRANRRGHRAVKPTSRSSSSGNDTTLIASTSKANRKPTPTPTTIIVQPAEVVNTSRANAVIESGGSGPSVSW